MRAIAGIRVQRGETFAADGVLALGLNAPLLALVLSWYGRLSLVAGIAIGPVLVAIGLAWRGRRTADTRRLGLGALVAVGVLAVGAYDLVRVPFLLAASIDPFQAIPRFGLQAAGASTASLATVALGWSLHVLNGIGLGAPLLLCTPRPRVWAGIVWGCAVEALMLATPYAEVYGIERSQVFLANSILGHMAFGATLAWGSTLLDSRRAGRLVGMALPGATLVLGTALISSAFGTGARAAAMSSRPDPLVLHTWDRLDVDRVCAAWIVSRYARPGASFRFFDPAGRIPEGTLWDVPQAPVTRRPGESASEMVVRAYGRMPDPFVEHLTRAAIVSERQPWAAVGDPRAQDLRALLAPLLAHAGSNDEGLRRGFVALDSVRTAFLRGRGATPLP